MSTTLLHRNFDLRPHNSFGVACRAEYLATLTDEAQLPELLQRVPTGTPVRMLGGGSNVLLPEYLSGLTILNQQKGIRIAAETPNEVVVEVGSGWNWHEFVLWTLRQGYGGIENLALIPGTVGAAPIQNIGAYGVELKDVFEALTAVELASGQTRIFNAEDCVFGYRHSIFKQQKIAGKFYLSKIKIKLSKKRHQVHTAYGAINQQLAAWRIERPRPCDVAAAVIEIRSSKLPNWRQLGNAGSFFKNPIISDEKWEALRAKFPNAPSYPAPHRRIKIPAGWLIDQCGWKGKVIGNVGCYERQALVIVNHGGATGAEIYRFSEMVAQSVLERFEIALEREVNVVQP
ncbi:MAG: UDP-N-acetylmuramate dehydrogenase [Bacteroidota bacterium]